MFRVEGKGPLRFLSFDESMRPASRPVRSWFTDSTDAESAGWGFGVFPPPASGFLQQLPS